MGGQVVGSGSEAAISTGDAVRVARIRHGLSARELSSRAGLSASYVTKLEASEIEPSLRAFAKIALAAGMTQAEIYFCVLQESLRGKS